MKHMPYTWKALSILCVSSLAEAALLRRHTASGIANVTGLDVLGKSALFDEPGDESEAEGQVDAGTAAMEDSIVEMLNSSHSGKPKGKGGKTGLEDGINIMKKMVNDQMIPKVVSAHKSAQASLDALYAAFQSCNSVRSSKMGGIPGLLKAKTTASAQHKKCRKNEDSASKAAQRCGALLKAKNGAKKAACDALKAVASDPNKEAKTCKSNNENYGQWVKRIKNWIDKKADAYDKADGRCKDATKKADDQGKTCKPLSTKAKGNKVSCDALQDQLETATCSVATKAKSSCNEYVDCFNAAKAALMAALPVVKKLEANRKAEWRALKRMECLLGIFADGDAKEKDVDKCKGKTHKTDHLNLKYGTVPRPASCKSPVPDPCSSNYIADEYASLPLKARAKDCTMCAGLSSTLPLPAGFEVRCPHDPAWSYVLDYEDDRSKDDIPSNKGVLAKGFSNKNAYYIGNAKLETLDIEQAEICVLSSTKKTKDGQCQYSCKTLSEGNWGNNGCSGCKQVSTNVKKIIAAMSGQGTGGNILVNVDPGIASFQPPFANIMWMCGSNRAPGVYKRIYNWGVGWHSEGWGISMRADHGAGNYEVGWYNNHCRFREKVDVDSFQIRVKTKARSISAKVNNKLVSSCSGSTPMGSTKWVNYGKDGIYADVDTSACGFTATPAYVTSLGGTSNHWKTTGSSETYSATAKGFRVYLYMKGVTPAYANGRKWHLKWIAQVVGQLAQPNTLSCGGDTSWKNTKWVNYGKDGIYVDVDTSRCGFKEKPVYITAMAGKSSLWKSTGSSENYKETAKGFRIYIYNNGIKPDQARGWQWHINWIARSSKQTSSKIASCAGMTPKGSTKWVNYGAQGVYVDVDTSSCGFKDTPVYTSALSGTSSQWKSKGSSEIYASSNRKFRVYIYLAGITPAIANKRKWHINWLGALGQGGL